MQTRMLNSSWANACALVHTVRCSVFTRRRVHDIRECLYAKFFQKKKKNIDWLAKNFVKWLGGSINLYSFVQFLPSVPILSFLPLMSFSPLLAFWPLLGFLPIRLSKMKRMTPAIHISLDNFRLRHSRSDWCCSFNGRFRNRSPRRV